MYLKLHNQKFKKLFDEILNDKSYTHDVKRNIAFTCKSEDILFDKKSQKNILKIYQILIESKDQQTRSDAEFFLLHSLKEAKKSFLPEIKPLLRKLSKMKYELTSRSYHDLYIIDYLEEFWEQIPNDTVQYLSSIYRTNPYLTQDLHKSRDVIELIGKMYANSSISESSRKKLLDTLLEFIKIGWPESNDMLKRIQSSDYASYLFNII